LNGGVIWAPACTLAGSPHGSPALWHDSDAVDVVGQALLQQGGHTTIARKYGIWFRDISDRFRKFPTQRVFHRCPHRLRERAA
jgi:hypothetical protein